MSKKLHFLFLAFVFCSSSFNFISAQQVSTYVYSYTRPTYVPINGTVLVSGVSSWDDNVYTNIPIGFTFYFEGKPYTTVGVNSNGFIWFGTGTTNTNEYNPISDASLGTGEIDGAVVGYGTNLVCFGSNLSGAPSGSPSISYQTSGAACSQTFTVQWKGAYAAADPGSASFFGDLERIDLQIVLSQSTNAISIFLHDYPYPYFGSSSGEVGIRGANNNDFISLTCWTAGCAQTTNNAAMGTLDPSYPATKSEFTFTPPACSYTSTTTSTNPNCGPNGTITITPTGVGPYTYIINNGTVGDTNQTGLFTGLGPGTFTTVVTNGTCAITSCATLTSSVVTPTASYTSPVCVGGNLSLSTPTVNGATYSWTGPNGFTSTQQNPVINNVVAADSGVYTIVDTVGGCASASGTTKVVIGGAVTPKVGSNSPICTGGTLNLADSTSGGTYSWTGPNGFTSTSQNPTITNAVTVDSGTYSVVQTVSGCASPAATVHVTISAALPAPKVGSNSPLCTGNTLTLADSTNGATYSWTGPNGFSSAGQYPTIPNVVAADSGTYTVINTVAGCSSLPATLHVAIGNIAPAPKVGSNSPLCAGATLTLTDSTGGATYKWSGPNNFTSSGQNPLIANTVISDSGTYTVVDTISGCVSLPAMVHVVINAMPATPKISSNSPVCTGDTIKLVDSTSASVYSWTGPNNFTSANQNPTIASAVLADSGIYTVVNTVGTCNSSPATINVVITMPPPAPQLSYNTQVCEGDTLNLSAANITGATFNWTGPNNFNNQQNPIIPNVSYADSGVYTVVATIDNCSSLPSAIDVSVNFTPVISGFLSNSPVCSGDTLKLSAQSINGATYSWTGVGNFSSNLQNITVPNASAVDSGLFIATATFGNCTSVPDTFHAIILPPPATPTLGANRDTICSGDSTQACVLNAFRSYQWNTVLQGNLGDTTQCISLNNPGNYYVTVTDNNGCSAVSGHPPLTISVYPVTSVSIVVLGDTLSSFGAVDYQWRLNDTDIAGATTSLYIARKTGYYSLRVTDINGCTSTSSPTFVSITGINEVISIEDIEIYPNPASAVLNIRFNGQGGKNCTLLLFDILGNQVMELPLYFNNTENKALEVSYLPKGMYLLQLQTGDQAVTKKIVLQ